MTYTIVEFEGDNCVAIVCTKWIVGSGEAMSCYWPNQRERQAVVGKHDQDEHTWQRYRLLRTFKTVGKRVIIFILRQLPLHDLPATLIDITQKSN